MRCSYNKGHGNGGSGGVIKLKLEIYADKLWLTEELNYITVHSVITRIESLI
jgi:hypothetical protein